MKQLYKQVIMVIEMIAVILFLFGCGYHTVAGPQGIPGKDGQPGIAGLPGNAGLPGSKVTFVEFCTEVTNYPSTFPEYGLCIDGQVYAVYSANGGFGVLLPDGNYNSNAINSACNFTLVGCMVTH